LVNVKFGAGVTCIPRNNFLDSISLVVIKHLHIKAMKKVKVNLVAVIAYPHDEAPFLKKNLNLLIDGKRMKVPNSHPNCVT
jgi:hypothetical protein